MAEVDKSEKITVNLGLVDLGQIDLLVNEGFYANRTDFIRTAIRNQLDRHADAFLALAESTAPVPGTDAGSGDAIFACNGLVTAHLMGSGNVIVRGAEVFSVEPETSTGRLLVSLKATEDDANRIASAGR